MEIDHDPFLILFFLLLLLLLLLLEPPFTYRKVGGSEQFFLHDGSRAPSPVIFVK